MRNLLLLAVMSLVLYQQSAAQTELTDKKNIAFAWNVRNYNGTKVDSLRFDIYYPTGAMSNKKYPVYFNYHAGGFISGSKEGITDFSDALAEYGFVVIVPDYRLGYLQNINDCADGKDTVRLQEAIYRAMQDVNACIRYITNRADAYGIDTSWVFIGGNSAGGTLALNDAYINDSIAAIYYPNSVATLGKLQTSGNNEPYRYTVKGICVMWGAMPYNDSLINSKSAIPTILFKGGKDTKTPNGVGYYNGCTNNNKVRAGLGIYNVMAALHKPCVYHFQPNGEHAAFDDAFCIKNTSCFFKASISKNPYSGYYQYYKRSCR
jgi:acetyl esterase/lipase